jgi:peptidyl-prolyl cis-trans isomerase SurA
VLERLVMERVQTQAAQDAGIKVTDQEVDRAIESVAQQNKMSAGDLRMRVESSGMSWTKYRDELRKQVQVIRLREREVDSKVQVYDGEIDNFIAARGGQGAATGPTEFDVQQILVRVPEDASEAQKAQLKAKAEGLLKQAQASNADFAALARANSTRRKRRRAARWASAKLDACRRNSRMPWSTCNRAACAGVVESANGFHVLKLASKRMGAARSRPRPTASPRRRCATS